MNNLAIHTPFFHINFVTAILVIISMAFWTRFSINMLLRLAERVGLVMTNGEMPSPQSTEVKDEISIFKPSECIHCKFPQDFRTFIPFLPFFRDHKEGCIFNGTYKNQKSTLFTELFFLLASIIIVGILYFCNSHYSLELLFVYAISIPLIIFDINFHWVPDRFSFLFLFSGLAASSFALIYDRVYTSVGYAAILTLIFMMSSFIRKRDVASSGDVLLIAGAGAWTGISNIFYVTISLLVIGVIFAVSTLIKNMNKKEDEENVAGFPFGPAIMGATIITMLINIISY